MQGDQSCPRVDTPGFS